MQLNYTQVEIEGVQVARTLCAISEVLCNRTNLIYYFAACFIGWTTGTPTSFKSMDSISGLFLEHLQIHIFRRHQICHLRTSPSQTMCPTKVFELCLLRVIVEGG